MLSISKNVLFPGHNHLLTTGADDLTLYRLSKKGAAFIDPLTNDENHCHLHAPNQLWGEQTPLCADYQGLYSLPIFKKYAL